jgi:hypothetical protein
VTKNDELCGSGGKGKPLYALRNLVAMLEREEAARKEREEREKKMSQQIVESESTDTHD